MAPRYELAVGLRKGHRTTKIRIGKTKQDKKHTIRPSRLKGVSLKYNLDCQCTVIAVF
jgi:large subunit ribosomal protein L36e